MRVSRTAWIFRASTGRPSLCAVGTRISNRYFAVRRPLLLVLGTDISLLAAAIFRYLCERYIALLQQVKEWLSDDKHVVREAADLTPLCEKHEPFFQGRFVKRADRHRSS